MKAIVVDRPVKIGALKISEIDRPSIADGDVLIRVLASSANPVDLFPTTTAGYVMGGRKPVVLGTDFAGVVEAIGKDVTQFQPGDAVFGGGRGAFAEYKAIAANGAVARKPAGVSFEHAGAVGVAATTALQALRDHGHIERGQKTLINGASGGVGTFAVQIAKALGGVVTAVCSTRNVEMIQSLGADRVIDYSKEDFTRGSERYDLIVDVAGSHSFSATTRVLEPHGTFVLTGLAAVQHRRAGMVRVLGRFAGAKFGSMFSRRKVAMFIANLNQADMEFLAGLLGSGEVTPVIERSCSLAEVPVALSYLNEGHTKAKVAIDVST